MTDTSREALIKMLIECLAGPAALTTREATAIKDAADMLEADARDTAWQRGFQSGVSSNEKTAKDAIAALAAEQAAHRETNRLMTEALTQAEALTPMLTPILCDKCGIETPDPWHSSDGANKHIHTCDACHAQQVAVPAWTIAEERMPKPCVNVLAYTGKAQPIRAQWVPAKTLVASGDGDFGEYNEATDEMWWPEGWYETNEHEETHWMVDDPVTHWMPLPPSPQGDT